MWPRLYFIFSIRLKKFNQKKSASKLAAQLKRENLNTFTRTRFAYLSTIELCESRSFYTASLIYDYDMIDLW